MSAVEDWLGDDWEAYCLLLLSRHYGADNLQTVPARHDGDLGIEAFTHNGCAVQCYAAKEPLGTQELYIAQRDKLTTDLGKLEKYQSDLLNLLGPVKIEKYLFMVPRHDSRKIVQHATAKATEYRAKNLPHLHADFRIIVVTADSFAEEREQVLKRPRRLIEVETSSSDQIQAWISFNDALVSNIDRKLKKVVPLSAQRGKYIEGLITQYIDGNNALDTMRRKHPDQWEYTERYKNFKESLLVLEHSDVNPAPGSIAAIARDVEKELAHDVPALDPNLCRVLSWSSIADWLMRCPLDFYTPEQESR